MFKYTDSPALTIRVYSTDYSAWDWSQANNPRGEGSSCRVRVGESSRGAREESEEEGGGRSSGVPWVDLEIKIEEGEGEESGGTLSSSVSPVVSPGAASVSPPVTFASKDETSLVGEARREVSMEESVGRRDDVDVGRREDVREDVKEDCF